MFSCNLDKIWFVDYSHLATLLILSRSCSAPTLLLPCSSFCPSPPSLPAMIGITFPEPHTAHLLILCNTFAVRRDSGELFYTISQLHFHITKYHKKELNQTLPPIALCSTYDQLAPFLNKPSVFRHLNLKTAQVNIQQNN